MKAMIFAAGLGTRLHPLTESKPKALMEIQGYTLLEWVIKNITKAGINDIVINVHHFADQIIKYLHKYNNFGANIIISDESELLLDTGGGLKKASPFLQDEEPILLHNVDIITNIDLKYLINYHCKNKPLATLAVMHRHSNRQLLINSDGWLCGWQNIKTGEKIYTSDEIETLVPVAYCGISVIDQNFLQNITDEGVFSIIQVFLQLAKLKTIHTCLFNNIYWNDVGCLENLINVQLSDFKF